MGKGVWSGMWVRECEWNMGKGVWSGIWVRECGVEYG